MGTEYELLIRTLLHTGLRPNEFAHMRADWINFQKGEIRVPPEDGDWTPKSRAGSKVLPLRDPHTKRVLRNWFSVHDEIGMSRTTIWRRVTEVTDGTSITKKITPHVLCHTYWTSIAARGATAQYIKQTMGHESLKTSQKYIRYRMCIQHDSRNLSPIEVHGRI
jgi:integrase/recombinase XerD